MDADRPGVDDVDPDRLAALEEERSFLLRSLRDLDAEHVAGDVDEHDYTTLRDGYTKRAADVMREIDDGRARLPADARRTGHGACGIGAAVVAAAVGAGAPRRPIVGRAAGRRRDHRRCARWWRRRDARRSPARRPADPLAAMELYGDVLELHPEPRRGADVQRLAAAVRRPAVERRGRRRRCRRRGPAEAARGRRGRSHVRRPALLPRRSSPSSSTATSTPAGPKPTTCLELDPPADLRAETESYLAQLD